MMLMLWWMVAACVASAAAQTASVTIGSCVLEHSPGSSALNSSCGITQPSQIAGTTELAVLQAENAALRASLSLVNETVQRLQTHIEMLSAPEPRLARTGPFVFTGGDQRIRNTQAELVTANGARTVILSLKMTAPDQIPFSLGGAQSSGGANSQWAISPSASTWGIYGLQGTYDEIISVSTSVVDGAWHRIAVSYEPSSRRLRAYVDGAEVGSIVRSSGESYGTVAGYRIGGWSNPDRYFNGEVRNITVYDDALTADELVASTATA